MSVVNFVLICHKKALGSVIVQEGLDKEKPIYFINKVLKGDKLPY